MGFWRRATPRPASREAHDGDAPPRWGGGGSCVGEGPGGEGAAGTAHSRAKSPTLAGGWRGGSCREAPSARLVRQPVLLCGCPKFGGGGGNGAAPYDRHSCARVSWMRLSICCGFASARPNPAAAQNPKWSKTSLDGYLWGASERPSVVAVLFLGGGGGQAGPPNRGLPGRGIKPEAGHDYSASAGSEVEGSGLRPKRPTQRSCVQTPLLSTPAGGNMQSRVPASQSAISGCRGKHHRRRHAPRGSIPSCFDCEPPSPLIRCHKVPGASGCGLWSPVQICGIRLRFSKTPAPMRCTCGGVADVCGATFLRPPRRGSADAVTVCSHQI